MCGIIHVKKLRDGKKARKTVAKRYYSQKHRGSEGFGFIEIKKGFIVNECRSVDEKGIMKYLEESDADEILFHHRYPTSTPNFVESTHPIRVSHESLAYDYFVVHNGIVTNDKFLRDEHKKQGFSYSTELRKALITPKGNVYLEDKDTKWNDSEALAIDFVLALENNIPMKSYGSVALVALQFDKLTMKVKALYWGHNAGSPLCIEDTKDVFSLSSMSGKDVEPGKIFCLDYETMAIISEDKTVGGYYITKYYNTHEYNKTSSVREVTQPWNKKHGFQKIGFADIKEEEKKRTRALELMAPEASVPEPEEDDFILDKEQQMADLKEALNVAVAKNDYDSATEIEGEIEVLKDDILNDKMKILWPDRE